MRVLLLSRYDRMGASSRLRTMQYLSYLEQEGFEITVAPLFDADYIGAMYAGRRSARKLIQYLTHRIQKMRQPADLVWLEKEALPWVPWLLEAKFWPRDTPIVVDYDDAIFHRYDQNKRAIVRWALHSKIDEIMASATRVVVGNRYLAARARAAGARHIHVVPTVVDTRFYQMSQIPDTNIPPRLGWIGTPETWRSFANHYSAVFERVARECGASVRIVGAEMSKRQDGVFEFLPWSEDSEVRCIQAMDIGLMPLPDTPWARGKCGYKLIQYMACGLPVVASPVGVNTEIVEHGVNGFLADTEKAWEMALRTLIRDASMREKMGIEGRRKVEGWYSLSVQAPRIAQVLRSASQDS